MMGKTVCLYDKAQTLLRSDMSSVLEPFQAQLNIADESKED